MKEYFHGPMDYAKPLSLRFRVGSLDLPERGGTTLTELPLWQRKLGTLDNGEKAIAILGHRWWPQTTEEERDMASNSSYYVVPGIWKKFAERPKV